MLLDFARASQGPFYAGAGVAKSFSWCCRRRRLRLASRFWHAVGERMVDPAQWPAPELRVSVLAGLVEDSHRQPGELLEMADQSLYSAKAAGGERVEQVPSH